MAPPGKPGNGRIPTLGDPDTASRFSPEVLMSTIAYPRPLLAAAVLLLAPTVLDAQEPPPRDTLGPRAGRWAAEVGAGTGLSGTLLRFRSPATAWLLGVDGSFAQSRQELPDPFGGTQTETVTQVDLF